MTLITTEIIKQQDLLKDLSDEQIQAFEKLGNNLFKKAIDDQTGVWHRRLEEDVKEAYGISEKPQGMKSYEFLKHAHSEFLKKVEAEKDEIKGQSGNSDDLKREYEGKIEKLKKELKDAAYNSGSELLKKDLEDYKKRVADLEQHENDLKKQMSEQRKALEDKIQSANRQNLLLEVGYERAQSLQGVEFDPLIPEDVRNTVIESKWGQLLNSFTPEKVEIDGKMVTQWRDKQGKLVYNESNLSELATTKDLLLKDLKPILKQGRQQTGAGTGGGSGSGGSNFLDLRGAKSQVAADEAIDVFLLGQGLKRATKEFAEKKAEIRQENGVEKLPIQ